VSVIFQLLLLSVFTSYSSSIANQILIGAGHVRTVAIVLICGSIINFGLSLALIGRYGLAGVAVATVTASVVGDLVAMPWLLQRKVGLSAASFIRGACGRPAVAVALQMAVLGAVRFSGRPEHWPQLMLQGTMAGLGSVAVLLAVGLDSRERRRFVVQPLSRLFGHGAKAAATATS
jgi:Na+-driven multidrug efflux pump